MHANPTAANNASDYSGASAPSTTGAARLAAYCCANIGGMSVRLIMTSGFPTAAVP